jgi:hypothetical protein
MVESIPHRNIATEPGDIVILLSAIGSMLAHFGYFRNHGRTLFGRRSDMLPLAKRVRNWLTSAPGSIIHECRNCGTTLDEQRDSCYVCGADEIACYDLR